MQSFTVKPTRRTTRVATCSDNDVMIAWSNCHSHAARSTGPGTIIRFYHTLPRLTRIQVIEHRLTETSLDLCLLGAKTSTDGSLYLKVWVCLSDCHTILKRVDRSVAHTCCDAFRHHPSLWAVVVIPFEVWMSTLSSGGNARSESALSVQFQDHGSCQQRSMGQAYMFEHSKKPPACGWYSTSIPRQNLRTQICRSGET